MLTKNKIYIIGILLLFTTLVALHHFVPEPVNWKLNFSGNSKSPYGCSVANDILKIIFPGKELTINTSSFYLTLTHYSSKSKNLIIITDKFEPDRLDLSALLDYVADGNSVFISALNFSDKFCDTLHFKTKSPVIDTSFFKKDKEVLKLVYLNNRDSSFSFKKAMPTHYFLSFDTLHSALLGNDGSGNSNFIVTLFGKGRIYLHCQPLAFTNFHLLYSNYKYACSALSHLPVATTIWDQYYKPGTYLNLSPVRYILSEPALRSAYFLILITILVYMVFGAKRKQRIIPVIQPEQNTSLNFVITVGRLYFKSQNHADLAKKKIIYFYEYLRNRYYFHRIDGDAENIRILSLKSGVEAEKIKNLLKTISVIEKSQVLYQESLIGLHKQIENFYKKCK
jgi:hypothetical protein